MKRLFTITVVILLIVISSTTLKAQDLSPSDRIVLQIQPDSAQPALNDIVQTAMHELDTDGVSLEMSDNSRILPLSPNLQVSLSPFRINLLQLDVDLETPVHLSASPILYPDFYAAESETSLSFLVSSDDAGLRTAAELISGLGLYAINKFDLAQQHLQSAHDKLQELAPDLRFWWANGITLIAFYQGNCALESEQYETAADFLAKSLYVLPGSEANLASATNLAWTDLKLGRSNDAFSTMDEVVQNAQNDVDRRLALTHRAQLYARAARYDDAVTDMTTAIQLDPTNPDLYTLRGQMYLYLYQWDNVLADYNKAIQLDPSDADAYFDRGILYYSVLQTGAENYPLALTDFQTYLQLAPDGDHSADAAKYVTQIQAEQQALGK